jgi:hypothetical protein
MNPTPQNPIVNADAADASTVDATLRLIASLPAPEGLEDRIIAGLHAAPRTARILHWPAQLRQSGGWTRTAAAAAIVLVVVGVGWGICFRAQPPQPTARGVVASQRPAAAAGGFSSAGAMRTPQTLNGPVLVHPVIVQAIPVKPAKKVVARTAPKPLSGPQPVAASKDAVKPLAPPAEPSTALPSK